MVKYKCTSCLKPIDELKAWKRTGVQGFLCAECYKLSFEMESKLKEAFKNNVGKVTIPTSGVQATMFNEPSHYHKHEIDTITFLQKGFPPEVFMGFSIGSSIKYFQRYQDKGGREDLVKALDFAKRTLDWYDKTHS